MANTSYTLDNYLIPSVIRRAHIPIANVTFQSADIAELADGEISTAILNTILSVREGFYLTSVDLTPDANGVVQIPYRAIGGRINKVFAVSGNVLIPLARIEASDLTNTVAPPALTYAFYIQGNNIVTIPVSGFPIRVFYYTTPSTLTSQINCSQITAISGTTITVSSAPTTFVNGYKIDFVQDQPPFGLLSFDQAISSISGTTITFVSVPSQLQVGDWICPAGQSPIAQIPKEFLPVLCQRVAVRILEIQGHMQRLQAAQAKLTEIEKDVMSIVCPRVEENPKKIVPNRSIVSPNGRANNWIVSK